MNGPILSIILEYSHILKSYVVNGYYLKNILYICQIVADDYDDIYSIMPPEIALYCMLKQHRHSLKYLKLKGSNVIFHKYEKYDILWKRVIEGTWRVSHYVWWKLTIRPLCSLARIGV